MPFDVPLPRKLKAKGWKVKIREKERIEPPHVTVMHKVDEWRLGLRDRQLLVPPGGKIRDIDPAVMQIIGEYWEQLIAAWDTKYPENPVRSVED
jgi:hypothetical protein